MWAAFFTAESQQVEGQAVSGRRFQRRTIGTRLLDTVLHLRRQRSDSGADGAMIIIVRSTAHAVAFTTLGGRITCDKRTHKLPITDVSSTF